MNEYEDSPSYSPITSMAASPLKAPPKMTTPIANPADAIQEDFELEAEGGEKPQAAEQKPPQPLDRDAPNVANLVNFEKEGGTGVNMPIDQDRDVLVKESDANQ